jgi:hypothetical protein
VDLFQWQMNLPDAPARYVSARIATAKSAPVTIANAPSVAVHDRFNLALDYLCVILRPSLSTRRNPMNRRNFGIAGVSAGALAAMAGSAFAQVGGQLGTGDEMAVDCAKACADCARACDSCSTHCAHQLHTGKQEHMTTLMTCQDCADFCVAAAQIVARGGPFSKTICGPCADACGMCAKECEKFPDDEHMKMCAEECRKCEKACRAMV